MLPLRRISQLARPVPRPGARSGARPVAWLLASCLTTVLVAASAAATAPAALAGQVDGQSGSSSATKRVIADPAESARSLDVAEAVAEADTGDGATVTVTMRRKMRAGDTVGFALDLDQDGRPEVGIGAYYGSEYQVLKMKNWDKPGKDITGKGCAAVAMRGKVATLTFRPDCFSGPVASYSLNVVAFNSANGVDQGNWDYLPVRRAMTDPVNAHA